MMTQLAFWLWPCSDPMRGRGDSRRNLLISKQTIRLTWRHVKRLRRRCKTDKKLSWLLHWERWKIWNSRWLPYRQNKHPQLIVEQRMLHERNEGRPGPRDCTLTAVPYVRDENWWELHHEDDVSELTEWNGYIADSSLDEVSSEDPLPSPTGLVPNNSRFLASPETLSPHQWHRGRWRTVNKALLQQGPWIFVRIHPNKDVASIPKVKNSDTVWLGFNNVDGKPATVTNKSKVNTIRRYVRKNDLDGFLVWKQILIGKRCLTKGNFQSCSGQRMLSVPWSLLIDLRTGDIDNREVLLVWFSVNWLQRYRKWAVMT